MKTAAAALFAIIVCIIHHKGRAFRIGTVRPSNVATLYRVQNLPRSKPIPIAHQSSSFQNPFSFSLASTSADDDGETSKAESILDELHRSSLPFRIVVIGNGAILETMSKLGPTSKSSISPKSGERLLTFASEDKSFEFHVKVEQVCKVAFVAKDERRVARFLSENGAPICSLILADKGAEAAGWFDGLVEKHGNEVIV
mmetsp:Transcript_14451/g.34843  ORF Transcript_14451/g.34843 Transcript_14451/m.34843 type:complete len:199 (+) Transcript_14451:404-1000(+)|eukprot:CAMPEP_0181117896 /NCGR_PEP_ID=MMETSP1071-20121207/22780_1 /TAXON_ID=35127 /ORGANISM="Thalassiosira sp., Strain NH16" /LENGTH=198 /DNA_ID=CAMNT_0023202341 /DNA_START=297 /DNA_END=893 /DNA_ORIENTATION=-